MGTAGWMMAHHRRHRLLPSSLLTAYPQAPETLEMRDGGESKWIGRIPNVAPSTYRKLLELRQDFGNSFQILLKPFKILDRRVSLLNIMLVYGVVHGDITHIEA
jgi:hypothetical protein